jgi:hypothetical protein
MRFQPSWIVEALQPVAVETVFLPLCPNPQAMLWFKRHGARLYVNDPRPTRFIPVHALVENDGEVFSTESSAVIHRVMTKSPDFNLNPFREWDDSPFDRRSLDYLFFWRETAEELATVTQRNLLFAAVYSVIQHWLSLIAAKLGAFYPPDEVLGHFLKRHSELVFRGRERAFSMNEPLADLSEEVDAGLYVVPLFFREQSPETGAAESFFQAWLKGSGNLGTAVDELRTKLDGWVFDWGKPPPFAKFFAKIGAAEHVAVCWSSDGVPPQIHEEEVISPLVKIFGARFPKYRLHMKTADRYTDEYDFLLTFGQEKRPR